MALCMDLKGLQASLQRALRKRGGFRKTFREFLAAATNPAIGIQKKACSLTWTKLKALLVYSDDVQLTEAPSL